MFSFFRKKPAAGAATEPAAEVPASPPHGEQEAGSSGGKGVVGERPRSALDWLNTDVGELLFGKKAGAEPATAPLLPEQATPVPGPTETTPAPAPESGERSPSPALPEAPGPQVATATTTATATATDADEPTIPGDRSSWVARLKNGLRRTGSTLADAFVGAEIGDELYDDLEAALLQADAGAAATRYLLDDLQARVRRADVKNPAAARRLLARCIEDLLGPLEKPLVIGEHAPTVIMVVGVNGAGKTTSIGKLARHLMDSDQKVLLAAADTFRAAAREQLLAWAERAGNGRSNAPAHRIEIVSQEGGDPTGVAFDAVVAGKARACDVVIVDTAGRLATQAHLMEELKKIRRGIAKAQAGAPHEVLLVIDGNTGQNGLAQVQAFDAALQLSGVVITKLDGTAKGGVLAAIALWSRARGEPVPVYFVGIGETLADLQTFRAREFAEALVS